jgi:hypothetical protein
MLRRPREHEQPSAAAQPDGAAPRLEGIQQHVAMCCRLVLALLPPWVMKDGAQHCTACHAALLAWFFLVLFPFDLSKGRDKRCCSPL